MSNKIYVGNLSYSVTESGLEELFAQYGEVLSAVIIKDKISNRSKGFGFIEMSEASSAEAAIAELDGKEFGGRDLRVNVAQDKPQRRR